MDFDTRELAQYAATLDRAAGVIPAEAGKVVTKGAVNIKTGARRRAAGLAHAPAYPHAITFDTVTVTPAAVWTEIGPDKGKRQGALGNILEHGTIKNAPIPHMRPAADEEQPRFERAMEDLAERALR
jgi:hypothetical protein